MGNLGIYQDAQGHRFRMTAEDARSRGYLPEAPGPEAHGQPEAPEAPGPPEAPAKAVAKAKNKARSSK